MMETTRSGADHDVQRFLSLTERGLGTVQEFVSLLRACDLSRVEDDLQPLYLADRGMAAIEEILAVLRESDRELLELTQRSRLLEMLAMTDPLTGLLNRRGFDEAVTREDARAQRFGSSVVVAYIDVSGLKVINDRHGHAAGDALLRTVAQALRTGARGSDIIARLGGDEFAALLLGTDVNGASVYLERVRAGALHVDLPGGVLAPIRLSAGVATRDEAGSLIAALAIADQRLLLDKRRQ